MSGRDCPECGALNARSCTCPVRGMNKSKTLTITGGDTDAENVSTIVINGRKLKVVAPTLEGVDQAAELAAFEASLAADPDLRAVFEKFLAAAKRKALTKIKPATKAQRKARRRRK